jgi:hypothetical protein
MLYSNGKVGACSCRDFEASSELILSNIEHESLESMWTGDRLHRLRDDWRTKNKVPEICGRAVTLSTEIGASVAPNRRSP